MSSKIKGIGIGVKKPTKVKGLTRNDFNTSLVKKKLLAENLLSEDETKRILDEACHVIAGLRHDYKDICKDLVHVVSKTSNWM